MSKELRQKVNCRCRWRLVLAGGLFAFMLVQPILARAATETPAPANSPKKLIAKEIAVKAVSDKSADKEKIAKKKKEDEKFKEVKVSKTARGTVNNVFRNTLTVDLAETEDGGEQIVIPLSANIKKTGFRDNKQLAYGDEVEVSYELTIRENKLTKERVYLSTVGTGVILGKKAAYVKKASSEGAVE